MVAELGIADLLAGGPVSAAQLAQATQAHDPSLYRVLRLLALLGVLTEHDGRSCAGGCPAGSVALSGGPGQCYHKLGTPVTITSASVSSVVSSVPPTGRYGFLINLPAADLPALAAIITTAADAHGYLDISVAGRTWLLPRVLRPFTGPLEIAFPSKNQVLQLHRILVPSG